MIRPYQHGDHEAIAEIFPRAIHEIASKVYSAEQCRAWSERKPNPAHWEKRCARKKPFVFVSAGRVAGFLELDPDGHIDCLYVHPGEARKGIASALIDQAVAASRGSGLSRLFVEASLCARPVFEKKGFRVMAENTVTIRDVRLTNYKMELKMGKPAKRDLKREFRELYHATAKRVAEVTVPPLSYLMVDGEGNPNQSPSYTQAVEALFSVSYTAKFALKKGEAAIDYTVMPLEGLWWADNWSVFQANERSRWK